MCCKPEYFVPGDVFSNCEIGCLPCDMIVRFVMIKLRFFKRPCSRRNPFGHKHGVTVLMELLVGSGCLDLMAETSWRKSCVYDNCRKLVLAFLISVAVRYDGSEVRYWQLLTDLRKIRTVR